MDIRQSTQIQPTKEVQSNKYMEVIHQQYKQILEIQQLVMLQQHVVLLECQEKFRSMENLVQILLNTQKYQSQIMVYWLIKELDVEVLAKILHLNLLHTKLSVHSYSSIIKVLWEIEQKWMDTKLLLKKEQVWLSFLVDIKFKHNVQNNAETLDMELKQLKC